ncbi:hypothetical protein GJ744_007362 [Endocarpon pusillum]|uniref:Uncharacterized protein n=1 Tax=Endocarpon pusillum TaxID=364733 RepID=A0A8H7AMM1_9EURO|nr:hypothetical protein GJ744_007362 [Endocarpon pusillum]
MDTLLLSPGLSEPIKRSQLPSENQKITSCNEELPTEPDGMHKKIKAESATQSFLRSVGLRAVQAG